MKTLLRLACVVLGGALLSLPVAHAQPQSWPVARPQPVSPVAQPVLQPTAYPASPGIQARAAVATVPPRQFTESLDPRLMCPPGSSSCEGQGSPVCIDLASNPDHCGACGNACAGGERCQQGQCQVSGDFSLAIEPTLELGYGTLVTGDQSPYNRGVDVCFTSGDCGSYYVFPETPPFGGGFQLGASATLHSGDGIGLWLRFGWQSYGADHTIWETNGLRPVDSLSVEDLALHVGSQFTVVGGGVSDIFRMNVTPFLGYRDFSRTTTRGSETDTYSADMLSFGGRVAMDFGIFMGLRAGAYVAVEGNLPLGSSWTFGSIDSANEELEALLHTGITVSWLQPLARPSVPAPAPLAPVPVPAYVLITSGSGAEVTERDGADVTRTPRYADVRPTVQTVAVLAPDRCANQGLAQATGVGGEASEVLATQCGVEMGEIERALTLMGFRVISWRTMSRVEGLPQDRARELGAQVLFQINSLERSENMVGVLRSERSIRYFFSNPMGERGAVATMANPDADVLDQIIAQRSGALGAGQRPGAGLDINAVDVATGQTIWLYQWRQLLEAQGGQEVVQLVHGIPDLTPHRSPLAPTHRWQAVDPLQPAQPVVQQQPGYRSGSRTSNHQQVGFEDELQNQLFHLLRQIIGDAAHQFRCGESTDPSIPQCVQPPPGSEHG